MSMVSPDNVALLKSVWGPLERGESQDFGPLFDLFADEIMFKKAGKELHGKAALARYFAASGAVLSVNGFMKPLEYYADGNRVVMVGLEAITVRATGECHEGEYAVVIEMRDGRILSAVNIQDLTPVADIFSDVMRQAGLD